MVTVVGNGHGNASLNTERECLHLTNTLEKGMNSTILAPGMDKYKGRQDSLILVW